MVTKTISCPHCGLVLQVIDDGPGFKFI
jgi:hypothetical protein